jgi:hypothetical protein
MGRSNSSRQSIAVVVLLLIIVYAAVELIRIINSNFGQFSFHTREWNRDCTAADGRRVFLNDSEAICLDGSKPAYYIRQGFGDGQTKWNIFFEGGGWCYDLRACLRRSQTLVGTSKDYPSCLKSNKMKFYQDINQAKNPLMYNWNMVHIKYCDASSYAGDAVHTYQVMSYTDIFLSDSNIS